MIKPEQIPDEVVEAAARAIGAETYVGNKQTLRDAARAAIAAALNTWPGARKDWTTALADEVALILPLPTEARSVLAQEKKDDR